MKKGAYLILALLLLILCAVTVTALGQSYTATVPVVGGAASPDDYTVELDQDREIVRLVSEELTEEGVRLRFRSVARGKAYVIVRGSEDASRMFGLYVHRLGIITMSTFFGDCTGDVVIPVSICVFLAALLLGCIRQYRRDVGEDLYRYKNVKDLGLIAFLAALLIMHLQTVFRYKGLIDTIETTLRSAAGFSTVALPIAFVVSILVSVSNLRLMRKEGRNWRNMLGCILGAVVCLATLFPHVLGEILQRSSVVNVHNQRGAALYIEEAVENAVFAAVTYLECILLGVVILSVKAARRIPAFDKTHILILGCQVRPDGGLTSLLKGRADKALEFSRMQGEETGKEPVFVPSGGQGPDEPVSEAAAIRSYLLSQGVPEGRILPEDRSANTFENLRNSAALIREREGGAEAKLAFATTNYHVFRAGVLASGLGLRAEGIGSRTKRYFWINAFIREFAAAVYSERKTHVRVIALLLLVVIFTVFLLYLSNVL